MTNPKQRSTQHAALDQIPKVNCARSKPLLENGGACFACPNLRVVNQIEIVKGTTERLLTKHIRASFHRCDTKHRMSAWWRADMNQIRPNLLQHRWHIVEPPIYSLTMSKGIGSGDVDIHHGGERDSRLIGTDRFDVGTRDVTCTDNGAYSWSYHK